jgi:hypothetical protein
MTCSCVGSAIFAKTRIHLSFFSQAKGKGVLKTYWANPKLKPGSANGSWEGSSHQDDEEEETEAESEEASDTLLPAQIRLVDWIVKLMSDDVRKIVSNKMPASTSCFYFSNYLCSAAHGTASRATKKCQAK